MKKTLLLYVGFVACFSIGFVCGMFAQMRIFNGDSNVEFSQPGNNAGHGNTPNFGGIKCLDGTMPDRNGCCAGEEYTYVIDSDEWACCPETGDCFPPIPVSE